MICNIKLHLALITCYVLIRGNDCFRPALIPTRNTFSKSHRKTVNLLSTQTPLDPDNSNDTKEGKQKNIVIIGGGWAGFSAAETLSKNLQNEEGYSITILDASKRGSGGLASGWRTKGTNRSVEAGIHGFWREYRNTFDIIDKIEGVDRERLFTPFTPSVLVSERGRVALAPVLGEEGKDKTLPVKGGKNSAVLDKVIDLLPPPIDLAFRTEVSPSSPLSIIDRLSGLNLLPFWSDFIPNDPKSWKKYDSISAEELFLNRAGITPTLYKELVLPLLHVLPMAPGWDCSAAAALSCFHVFALQSRGAFDVKWCRGTITQKIFQPWEEQLLQRGVQIRGSSKVSSIAKSSKSNSYFICLQDGDDVIAADAIVFAVGGPAMNGIVKSSPDLPIRTTTELDKLRGVTCVSVRLFLEPDAVTATASGTQTQLPEPWAKAMHDSPVFVCGPDVGKIPELKLTGFCIYDLQRLQEDYAVGSQDALSVIEVDFFRADDLADLNDEQIIQLTIRAIDSALQTTSNILDTQIVDSFVFRARNAVSHFCIDSATKFCPPSVRTGDSLYICGDWIDRCGHSSWSTEKAVVTGRQAAGALLKDRGISFEDEVIPETEETEALKLLRKLSKFIPRAGGQDSLPLSPPSVVLKDAVNICKGVNT